MPRIILYAVVFAVSFGVTLGLSHAVRKLSVRYRLVPKIRSRDVHTSPTPRLGGIAMFVGMAIAMGVAAFLPGLSIVFDRPNAIIGLAIAGLIIVAIGVADDIWDIDWTLKLAGQILAAIVLAWQGIQLTTLPIGGLTIVSPWISLLTTIVLVVLVVNAVNFIDGLDGLVAGVTAIAGGVFFVYAYLLQVRAQYEYFNLASLTTVILVGACLGFLPLNWHPAKLFMGDAGSMLVGLMMAASTISITGSIDPATLSGDDVFTAYLAPGFIPLILPLAVLALPLLDFVLAVVRRMVAGKSPFSADRKHLHHRLLDMGHTHLGAVLILYMWTLLAAVGVMAFMFVPWFWALGGLAVAGLIVVVLTFLPLTSSRRASSAEEME